MPTLEVTNNSTNGIVVWNPVHNDETLTAAGADTWVAGTLLGRITASGKLTIYTSGAANGAEVPVAILATEEVFTGAGDRPARVIVGGQLRRADLVADGVGAITIAEADALRDYGIVSLTTTQLAEQDNQ